MKALRSNSVSAQALNRHTCGLCRAKIVRQYDQIQEQPLRHGRERNAFTGCYLAYSYSVIAKRCLWLMHFSSHRQYISLTLYSYIESGIEPLKTHKVQARVENVARFGKKVSIQVSMNVQWGLPKNIIDMFYIQCTHYYNAQCHAPLTVRVRFVYAYFSFPLSITYFYGFYELNKLQYISSHLSDAVDWTLF